MKCLSLELVVVNGTESLFINGVADGINNVGFYALKIRLSFVFVFTVLSL